MKLNKIALNIMLTILIIGCSMPSYASNNSNSEKLPIKINEYELLMSLDDEEFSKIEQGKIGESTEIIITGKDKIDNKDLEKHLKITKEELIKDYKDKIYKLKEWKVEQLKNVGYDEKQINAIKNFDGSEELMQLAATTVVVNIGLRNITYSSSGTVATVIADFNCAGLQSDWFLDVFGVVWSEPLTIVSKTGTVRYISDKGNSTYVTHNPINAGSLYGLQMKFTKYADVPGGDYAYYIHSGSMIVNVKSNTMVYDIAALAAYGNTTFSIDPSFSVMGDLGFSFSSGTNTAGEAYTSN